MEDINSKAMDDELNKSEQSIEEAPDKYIPVPKPKEEENKNKNKKPKNYA